MMSALRIIWGFHMDLLYHLYFYVVGLKVFAVRSGEIA